MSHVAIATASTIPCNGYWQSNILFCFYSDKDGENGERAMVCRVRGTILFEVVRLLYDIGSHHLLFLYCSMKSPIEPRISLDNFICFPDILISFCFISIF
jgi:hypothetical protein